MPPYNTPGVYIEEISTLPPSVAQVATAIPAFIGFTELSAATSSEPEVAQISDMLEFEQRFGKADPTVFTVDPATNTVTPTGGSEPARLLYYAVNLYFKNGGGRCYIVSIGNYSVSMAEANKANVVDLFEMGIDALKREDEPTLIVMPEAVKLPQAEYGGLCQYALTHAKTMADRFAILDVRMGNVDNAASFRGLVTSHLDYGAAYYPYLETTLTHHYLETGVTVTGAGNGALNTLKSSKTAVYNQVKKLLAEQRVTLPPSAAIAGIYARVDRERGVWKAPANVGVSSVIGPVTQITHDQQETLNIDANTGKSINAIRAFPGKGTLVWGARTLAGNDNEWRYVPVRRLFIMIEESCKKASAFAVFEPNDATTWLKVKGMLDSYLYGLWEQGALQGSKPDDAFYVQVGLGKTMSAQDVLEGRMIVQIGIAAVRPAEFVVLRFSHKLATG